MIEYLPKALSSLQTALSIGETLIGLKDSAKANRELEKFTNAIIEANCRIIDAQQMQSAMSSEIDELKQECMRLKNWDANEKTKYIRKQIAPGVFAYIENEFTGNLQDAHKYCCNCFDDSIKSTLQQSSIHVRRNMFKLACSRGCDEIIFSYYIREEGN